MKNLRRPEIFKHRIPNPVGKSDHDHGVFKFEFRTSQGKLASVKVIAATGIGWDHVSVSKRKSCPTWEEMNYIKDLFFEEDEVVMQLHVAKTSHINLHEYCLHLWRPQEENIPLPPEIMV